MTIETQPTDTGQQATTLPPEPPKVDEVKRYEKIYEMSKEMFSYSEGIIKNLEDKSRNNLTAATAIMGFAFLIRKPPEISTLTLYDLVVLAGAIYCVGHIYYCHIGAVRPQGVKIPKKVQLDALRSETFYPQGVIRHNFETLQDLYGWNLDLIKCKGDYVKRQQFFLWFVLGLSILYIVLSQVPKPATKEGGKVEAQWQTKTSALNRKPPPSQIQTPAPNPTTSTYTRGQISGTATTTPGPATAPATVNGASKDRKWGFTVEKFLLCSPPS